MPSTTAANTTLAVGNSRAVTTTTAAHQGLSQPPVGAFRAQTNIDNQTASRKTEPGLDGYCPVTLIKQTKWTKGNKKWGCIHRGRLYYFNSQEYRDMFLAAPDTFSPLLAGYDPVIYETTGNLVTGKRSEGVFYGGDNGPQVVILFSSRDSRDQFESNSSRYLNFVRQAMSEMNTGTVYR